MESNIKLHYNAKTYDASLTANDGANVLDGLFVESIVITLDAANIPKVVITCAVFDKLEVTLPVGEVQIDKVERFENSWRNDQLRKEFF
jgi:hypothetical protein